MKPLLLLSLAAAGLIALAPLSAHAVPDNAKGGKSLATIKSFNPQPDSPSSRKGLGGPDTKGSLGGPDTKVNKIIKK